MSKGGEKLLNAAAEAVAMARGMGPGDITEEVVARIRRDAEAELARDEWVIIDGDRRCMEQ